MAKEEIRFEDFLANVTPDNLDFVRSTHAYVTKSGCTYKIEAAKSGHVLSYILPRSKKVLLNYVFRKNGMIVRIYGDFVNNYSDILETLPKGMADSIEKSPPCKRLNDLTKCNSRWGIFLSLMAWNTRNAAIVALCLTQKMKITQQSAGLLKVN